MISIEDILRPGGIRLALNAESKEEAVGQLLDLLRTDDRVTDWEALRTSVLQRDAPALEENTCGICIAHGRTPAVKSLVMVAGRLDAGVTCPGIASPLKLVFLAAIPSAFNHEYLRVIGAIARICHDPQTLNKLLNVKDSVKFLHLLQQAGDASS